MEISFPSLWCQKSFSWYSKDIFLSLRPASPPASADICTGTKQTFCFDSSLLLAETSHATKIPILARIYRSRKGTGLGWRRMKVNRIVSSLGLSVLLSWENQLLLLSDLVIRTEFRAHTLNIMTVSPDNTFISKFSTLWNFTMRKCHRNKTFHSFF